MTATPAPSTARAQRGVFGWERHGDRHGAYQLVDPAGEIAAVILPGDVDLPGKGILAGIERICADLNRDGCYPRCRECLTDRASSIGGLCWQCARRDLG